MQYNISKKGCVQKLHSVYNWVDGIDYQNNVLNILKTILSKCAFKFSSTHNFQVLSQLDSVRRVYYRKCPCF